MAEEQGPERIGWEDMLRVYVAGDKQMFLKCRDATSSAVKAMEAVQEAAADGPTADLLDEAAGSLMEAMHAARMLAVGLEENRRMVLGLRKEVG